MTAFKLMSAAILLTLFAQTAQATEAAQAEPPQLDQSEVLSEPAAAAPVPRITAQVNGLVCDFCARALKKIFSKEAAVESIDVDLQAGTVQIILKTGQDISDERVAELIRKSGYSLVKSTREGGA